MLDRFLPQLLGRVVASVKQTRLAAIFLIDELVKEGHDLCNHRLNRRFFVADQGMVDLRKGHEFIRNFRFLLALCAGLFAGQLVHLLNIIVPNDCVISCLENNGRNSHLLDRGFCTLLLFCPKDADSRGEGTVAFWVVVDVTPLRLELGLKLLKLRRYAVVRKHAARHPQHSLAIVQLFSPEAIIGREETNAGKHGLAHEAVCHVSRDQTSKRTPEQKKWCFLLIDTVLFNRLKDQQPLVIVNVIGLLNKAATPFALTKSSLVDGKHLEVEISEVLCKTAVRLRVGAITMKVKHDGFPVVLWRVPVGFKVDLFPELDNREV